MAADYCPVISQLLRSARLARHLHRRASYDGWQPHQGPSAGHSDGVFVSIETITARNRGKAGMSKPIHYVYYTPAGPIELYKTQEQIEKHPAFDRVTRPAEGRPKLVGALFFMLQEMLDKAAEKDWFSITDDKGVMTTLMPSAISGFRILESIGEPADEPQISFRPKS